MLRKFLLLTGIAAICLPAFGQQSAPAITFVVKADSIKAHVEPTMYGIFFEDINMAADGGLYAELVKNRSFEFFPNLMGWSRITKNGGTGTVEVINRMKERPENPHFITLTVNSNSGMYGIANEGFRGMGIKKGETYRFSVIARQHGGSKTNLFIELADASGNICGHTTLTPTNKDWKQYSVKFTATATIAKAHLNVYAQNMGSIDMDMISLFPVHTWKNRPFGLRADLVQKLADMKPGFLRFPGGCIVEGRDLATRYQWKKTIGSIDHRESIINRWNTEVKNRQAPDYYQSFGLGFMEYFQLAEDIGAAPLPILNCGMACQFNTAQTVPLDQLDPYVQDALDLIEFANGSTNTKWGSLRAQLGHPAPFNLKLMGIGNEQWGDEYIPRWKIFVKAIKDKYPYMKLVSSVGPDPDGPKFDFLNTTFRALHADILDEHYYRSPQWFFDNAKRYDNYDRRGPRIFAGEYAAQSVAILSPDNKNDWNCALSEAAFMTGLEHNADVVNMASYAPLFAHVDGWQWSPDEIWFDNLKCYGTPDYYVQKLYSLNKGTDVVPLTLNNLVVSGEDGLYASSVVDKKDNSLIVKIVNSAKKWQNVNFNVSGKKMRPTATLTTLQSDRPDKVNSLMNPTALSPKQRTIAVKSHTISLNLQPYSFSIIRVRLLN